jgi:hypothetical protein
MSDEFHYPTEQEFQAMTFEEFESFWEAYDTLILTYLNPLGGARRARDDDNLPGLMPNDLDTMLRLKQAGWVPRDTHRNVIHPAWPYLWTWSMPGNPTIILSPTVAIAILNDHDSRNNGSLRDYA